MHEQWNAERYVELCTAITGTKYLPVSEKSIGDPILKIIMSRLEGFGDKPMRTVRDMQKYLRTTVIVYLFYN